jgi:GntR family transcriptional regulator, transcriptional repressor for pyruvate dehydrogenase complex
MTDTTPIVRKKTYELVAEYLLGEIGERRLAAGDVLPTERELTETLRVGRSSIREAFRMLESQGLIENGDSGLFVVAEPAHHLNRSLDLLLHLKEADIGELYEIRRLLESEFAALAAERRSSEQLTEMTAAIEAMRRHVTDEEAYIDADLRFHVCVAEATQNRFALHLMHAIREVLQRALRTVFESTPGIAARSIEDHAAIHAAIEAGLAPTARVEMHEHLSRVERETVAAERKPAGRRRR